MWREYFDGGVLRDGRWIVSPDGSLTGRSSVAVSVFTQISRLVVYATWVRCDVAPLEFCSSE